MHFFSAVQAENDVVHFFIHEIDHVIVDKHAVCGEGETEILVVFFFHTSCICHELLNNIPVHERFTAEEVHLEVSSRAGICDEEIKSLLTNLKAHERALTLIFTLACEAVFTVEIAGVCHVEAERLNHIAVILIIKCELFILIFGEKLSIFLQRLHIVDAKKDLLLVHTFHVAVFFKDGGNDLLLGVALIHLDDVICHLIHAVYRAAAGIENDIVTVQFILMYHRKIYTPLAI